MTDLDPEAMAPTMTGVPVTTLQPDPDGNRLILGRTVPIFMIWTNTTGSDLRVVIADPSPVNPIDVVVDVPRMSSVLTKTTAINRYRDSNGCIALSYPDGVTHLTLVVFT